MAASQQGAQFYAAVHAAGRKAVRRPHDLSTLTVAANASSLRGVVPNSLRTPGLHSKPGDGEAGKYRRTNPTLSIREAANRLVPVSTDRQSRVPGSPFREWKEFHRYSENQASQPPPSLENDHRGLDHRVTGHVIPTDRGRCRSMSISSALSAGRSGHTGAPSSIRATVATLTETGGLDNDWVAPRDTPWTSLLDIGVE
jgi:hypothetical protein